MRQVSVLITAIGGATVGEQTLKALKRSTNHYTIIGTDTTPLCTNRYEVDRFHQVPPANDASYVDTLLSLCEKYDVKALIPGSEPELKMISEHRDQFLKKNILPLINPASVIDTCLDKFKTMSFLQQNGFVFPRTLCIRNAEDLRTIDYFPMVLKPSIGGGGSTNTMLAQNKTELQFFGEYLLNIYPEYIVQEYVGTPETEYTVGVLCDMQGDFINSIVIKRNILTGLSKRMKVKNNSSNRSLGDELVISSGISQGEVVENTMVAAECERIALKLGATGALNIQCRVHQNKVYVFEINPRFSGTTSVRAMVGYNEPDVLIRKHILGEAITTRFKYEYAHIVRGLSETRIK